MNSNTNKILLDPTTTDAGGGAATATAAAPTTNGAAQPDMSYELNEFSEGPLMSFKFHTPVWHNFDAMRARYGDEAIMALVNSTATARIRTKVKNDNVPEEHNNKDVAQRTALSTSLMSKHKDGILFSEEDANNWRPDVRELSPNQMFKRAKEMFESGDPAKFADAQALLQRMQKVLQEQAAGEAAKAKGATATAAA